MNTMKDILTFCNDSIFYDYKKIGIDEDIIISIKQHLLVEY